MLLYAIQYLEMSKHTNQEFYIMRIRNLLLEMFAMGCLAMTNLTTSFAVEREEPEKYWNLAELSKQPAFRESGFEDSRYEGMKDLMVTGYGPNGSKAEFFAYVALPDTPKPEGGYPGIVLVHGGGGTAYPLYVNVWKEYGFAVIALDWYNQRPLPPRDKPAGESDVPRAPLEGGKRHDISANVSNAVLCNSLLRSWPDVNPDKIVLVGLSWGSWYGAIISAIDSRLKGVVEIYCGDLRENDNRLINGRFLHAAKVPMYWVASTHDQNVTMESLRGAFNECPTIVTKSLVIRLPHSHRGFLFDSAPRMAKHFMDPEQVPSLPILGKPLVKDGVLSAEIKSFGLGMGKALLCYSCSPRTEKRHLWEWKTLPAEVNGNTVSARIPEGVTQCFLSIYEENIGKYNDLCGTTEVVDINLQ